MILPSFLILPTTFDTSADIRVSPAGIGIFGIALLTAGFSLTALSCFAVKNPLFQADAVFLPSLYSCAIGLLTVFYDLLVFGRYVWKTPALLLTIAGAISTIVYGGLLIWTQRRIQNIKSGRLSLGMVPLAANPAAFGGGGGGGVSSTGRGRGGGGNEGNARDNESMWQDPSYYDNYVRNMYPASVHPTANPPHGGGNNHASSASGSYDPHSITEEEMQRQQMLMLLLQQPSPVSQPSASQSTFRIDWQAGREDDEPAPPPSRGYFAPPSAVSESVYSSERETPTGTSYAGPSPQLAMRRLPSEMQPWDGVWRTAAPVRSDVSERMGGGRRGHESESPQRREARRQEIERGGR